MSDPQQTGAPAPHEPILPFDGEDAAPAEDAAPRRRRRQRRVLITMLVLVLLAGGVVGTAAFYMHSVESKFERIDAFGGVPQEARPPVETNGALNILILGSDSRDPDSTAGSRSDTIIIAHLENGRKSAELISIPRDTWVRVPRSPDGQHGGREAKINAAYAWGGVPLVVQTVEDFTHVRIDHVMVIDFAGFKDIIDALGGVVINSERAFTSIHPPYRKFIKGLQFMDGETALDYSRQRKQFPDGDFARIRHQQQMIRAVLDKAASAGLLTSPGKLNDLVQAVSVAVSVDEEVSLLDMATDLRSVRGRNLLFFTSPTTGTGRKGSESVVLPDTARVQSFYDAVRRDAMQEIAGSGRRQPGVAY